MSVRALPMAKALVARGHTVTVLLPPWQNPEDAGNCWEEDGVTIENILMPPGIPGLFHLLTALRLTRRVLALAPDVVHLFKPKAYSGLTHWLLAQLPRARRPRLVVDTDDWEGPGGWNEMGGYSPAQRHVFTWQERWGLTHADAITVASRALETLIWALGVPPEQVFYVPNGTVYQKLDAKSRESGTDTARSASDVEYPTILLYTRFFEFPLSRVIDILCRVQEQVPQARLLIVGKGFSGEEQKMLSLARQAGLTDAVEYAGFVEAEALPDYFARANVAIYPFDDTLVNRTKCAVKLCDLLAAGIPVVAEAVGQNQEMIHHGKTGWLVEPGDVDSFGDAVVQLLEDAKLRARLGQAAVDDVQERLAWDKLVKTVERAFGMDEIKL
ncbi:MAG: glycosyltransferase family 4 protein [Chloroflexi bacterium]|nr:glycosyltransferase family 4 protein [Chloroflexota bacterium]